MRLSTSTNIFYERTDGSRIPVRESIRLCAMAGYQEMDFCFVDQAFAKTEFVEESWRDYLVSIREQAETLGVTFTQSHGVLYDFCNASDPWQEELVRRSVEGSQLMGAPWMVMHPSTKITDGHMDPRTREENITYFRRLSDCAGKHHVGIAIENMWGKTREGIRRYTVDPEEFLDLIDAIDSENVAACWDAEHGSIEGIDQPSVIRRLGHKLQALHISDQTSVKDIHILPYMGVTEWEPILRALAEIGYNRPFTYEIQHYLLSMPLELVPSAIRMSYEVGVYMVEQIEKFRNERNVSNRKER